MSSKHKITRFSTNEFAIHLLIRRKILRLTTLILSTALCMACRRWVVLWILLEINTLSFCYLIKTKEKTKINDLRAKYFIIQSISSGILVLSSCLFTKGIWGILPTIALAIKMASAPLQEWFLKILKNSRNFINTILITWQKLAPVFLLIFQKKVGILLLVIICSTLGSISQIDKKMIYEIIGYSSVFNIRWMLISLLTRIKTFFFVTVLYWIAVVKVMRLTKKSHLKTIESSDLTKVPVIIILRFSNLAGIPPFPNFVGKWMLTKDLLSIKMFFFSVLPLTMRSLNFYIYLKLRRKVYLKSKSSSFLILGTPSFLGVAILLSLTTILIINSYRTCLNKGLCW